MGSGTVMCCNSFLARDVIYTSRAYFILVLYKLFAFLLDFPAYFLSPYLFTSLLILFFDNGPIPFPGQWS